MNTEEILGQLTLEEKASLTSGKDEWRTEPMDRLGVRPFRMTDGPHGLRVTAEEPDKNGRRYDEDGVSMPAEVLSACSFDRDLIREMAEELGDECRARGIQMLLGPGVNIKRSPLCGRNFEYFSEDPYLAGEMGAAYVKGLQSRGVGACVKHFLVNSQETRRTSQSSEVDERTMREIYLPAFENVVKNAGPWGVMASYNRIGGTFATESRTWMTDVLRGEWGFDGCVISDWGATHHRVKAVAAGTDLTMPGESRTDHEIADAVRAGLIPESLLDEAARHVLDMAMKGQEASGCYDPRKGHQIAREVAVESAVLLKNDNELLPLCREQKIAFIGRQAAEPRTQGGGSSNVTTHAVIPPLEAAKALPHLTYAAGCAGTEPDETLIAEAVACAGAADAAVVMISLPPIMESEGIDRAQMCFPESCNALVKAVCDAQPHTVVVLFNGSPVEMPWADQAEAILEMYYPGESCGEALMDLLLGEVNPSGRLAETFPLRLEDNPSYLFFPGDMHRTEYREGVYVGYRYYASKRMPVRYPFGWGMSYTVFAYDQLKLDRDIMRPGEKLTVSVTVTNTGKRAGKEVVQLYIGVKNSSVPRPVRELRGFEKILLQPGETKEVVFTLDQRAFSTWNEEAHCFHMDDGDFEVQIRRSAGEDDLLLAQTVHTQAEPLDLPMVFDMNSLIGDVRARAAGKLFFDSHLREIGQGILASGIIHNVMGQGADLEQLPESMLDRMTSGLNSQTLQTLKMFLPGVDDFEWAKLIGELNNPSD